VLCPHLFAQGNVLTVAPPPRSFGKRGATVAAPITVQLREGYHVNSNTPSEDYLIPLRLTWNAAPLQVAEIVFPKPKMERYAFSETPLSVFTGDFEIVTRFRVPADAKPGTTKIAGKLRYQACNNKLCLPPATIDIQLPVDVVR
jgi:hypothetical protein